MKTISRQELILVTVTSATGIFILAMSWSEFKMVAKDHSAVMMFVMGVMLLFMAVGNLSSIMRRRSWMKRMETLGSTTTDSTLSTEGAPSVEK